MPVRAVVTGATRRAAAGLPRRAAELAAAQFDTVAADAAGRRGQPGKAASARVNHA